MNLLEWATDLARDITTFSTQIKHLEEDFKNLREQVLEMSESLHDMRERVIRLEAERNADRREMEAVIARFQTEVERAELKMRALPPTENI